MRRCLKLVSHMDDIDPDRKRFKQIYTIALRRIAVGNLIVNIAEVSSLQPPRHEICIIRCLRVILKYFGDEGDLKYRGGRTCRGFLHLVNISLAASLLALPLV